MVKVTNDKLRGQIGMMIKQHRQDKKITLEVLAENANLDGNNISRFERGEKLPHLISFLKLVIALDIKADDYLHIFHGILKNEKV